MKKLGIVISDGVGFRNFVMSDFIRNSSKFFDEVIIYSCIPPSAFQEYNLNCKIVELPEFKEHFVTWFFRKIKEVAHLQKFAGNNFGINDNLKANHTKAWNIRGLATRVIFGFTKYIHSEESICLFNKTQQFTYNFYSLSKVFKRILKKDEVNLLFFTHQRPQFIAPIIFAAEKLKIKTATFIFSWDNLASKGRMSGNFNYYLVWSDLMKQELLHFYESVEGRQIEIVGTPQFEPYALERYESTKVDFYKKFSLDINLKTICFTCGDISTSKNDELYIELIASFIITNQLIEKVNFLVRTSPAEDGSRFNILKEKFDFIKWNIPKWILARQAHQEPWSQRIPSAEDLTDLRGALEHSDIFINMLSTMTLDAMIFNKPVINPTFGNFDNGLYDDQRFLKYKHIEHVIKSKSTSIVKVESDFLNAINEVLETPNVRIQQQRDLINLEIGKPLDGTSHRIVDTLLKWIEER